MREQEDQVYDVFKDTCRDVDCSSIFESSSAGSSALTEYEFWGLLCLHDGT